MVALKKHTNFRPISKGSLMLVPTWYYLWYYMCDDSLLSVSHHHANNTQVIHILPFKFLFLIKILGIHSKCPVSPPFKENYDNLINRLLTVPSDEMIQN